jgi:hypothetical protein
MTYIIRQMTQNEVKFAIDWAATEGWNPGLNDAECFFKADPTGFFIGLLDNEPIATGCAIAYDDHFGFCGLYIVKPEYRAHGYGLELTKARLNYLGDRTVGLDGVLNKVAKYERLGYVQAHLNQRFQLDAIPEFESHPKVVPIKKIPYFDLETFDRRYFPAPRAAFLQYWISQPYAKAFAYVENDVLQGYGVIRQCQKGWKIGPLFADQPVAAKELFETLCSSARKGPVFLDVPKPNQSAQEMVRDYGMNPGFEVIRMYRNGQPNFDLSGVYGITTFELG